MYYQSVELHPPPHEVEMHNIDISGDEPAQPLPKSHTKPPSTLEMLGISFFGVGWGRHLPRPRPLPEPEEEPSHV